MIYKILRVSSIARIWCGKMLSVVSDTEAIVSDTLPVFQLYSDGWHDETCHPSVVRGLFGPLRSAWCAGGAS